MLGLGEKKHKIIGILWLTIALLLLLCFLSQVEHNLLGVIGSYLNKYVTDLLGDTRFLLPCVAAFTGLMQLKNKKLLWNWQKGVGLLIMLISISMFLELFNMPEIITGGLIGDYLTAAFILLIGKTGTFSLAIVLFVISIFILDIEASLWDFIKTVFRFTLSRQRTILRILYTHKKIFQKAKKPIKSFPVVISGPSHEDLRLPCGDLLRPKKKKVQKETEKAVVEGAKKEPVSVLSSYEFPSLSLLSYSEDKKEVQSEDLSKLLVSTLEEFGIKSKITGINKGPTVTSYELTPDVGVKVSRITSLANDIAMSLKTTQVRVVAPIPGKDAIGIEVPNREWQTVHIKEILSLKDWQNKRCKLPMALGKTIDGTPIIADLVEMPHLLIAGTTGSGKSVSINSIIMSLLYSRTPEELKLVLIDPKRVEFLPYVDIPHLMTPIITEAKKTIDALKTIIIEMENRYKKFSDLGAADLLQFHKRSSEKLPYIVVIIDELAELMLLVAKEIEDSITRLAQLSRGVGIHLVFATQRPSVDVITGVIKANLPSRIAFQVSSKVDSRTILDANGAEALLGKGDMLYLPSTSPKPIRAQGSFVTKDEIEEVIKFLRAQSPPAYSDMFLPSQKLSHISDAVEDENTLRSALLLVKERKRASTTLLQGALHISGGRASNLVSWMETKGIIGASQGAKPREIYLDKINELLELLSKKKNLKIEKNIIIEFNNTLFCFLCKS